MTVGEALKQMRLQAGLTQTEMTAGVVSESFYSKIERGVHAVDVQVLINILSAHHMDVVHFFSLLNFQKSETEPNFEIINQISFAQNKKDISALDKIKKELENRGGEDTFLSEISMEEQEHDAVKFYQRTLAIFIENTIFTELLIEGGFNPVINEQDIVHFQFNEINLDTKVKMETHAMNQFQGNAIPFEEMRQMLGKRADNVDETRLFANMITQPNAIGLIQAKSFRFSATARSTKSQPNST